MPQFCPNLDVISKQNKKKVFTEKCHRFLRISMQSPKKKGLQGKMSQFSQNFNVISKKKRKGLPSSTSWFLNVISMGLLKSTSPMRAPLKPMGPLKSMGPEVIVPPLPPSRRPWLWWLTAQTALGYNSTKPKFKTNYARNQISKQKNYWFYLRNIRTRKCASLNPARIA